VRAATRTSEQVARVHPLLDAMMVRLELVRRERAQVTHVLQQRKAPPLVVVPPLLREVLLQLAWHVGGRGQRGVRGVHLGLGVRFRNVVPQAAHVLTKGLPLADGIQLPASRVQRG
jgi:hypothetical protein